MLNSLLSRCVHCSVHTEEDVSTTGSVSAGHTRHIRRSYESQHVNAQQFPIMPSDLHKRLARQADELRRFSV